MLSRRIVQHLRHLQQDLSTFDDPFSRCPQHCNHDAVKLQLKAAPQPPTQPQHVPAHSDHLLPVYCELAQKVLPSDFNFRCNTKTLVLGGKNSGKTVLLQRLAYFCASTQLRHLPRTKRTLPVVPIIVRVPTMCHVINMRQLSPTDDLLAEYVRHQYQNDQWTMDLLLDVLRKQVFWLLIDGLDVATQSNQLFQRVFVEWFTDFNRQKPDVRTVAVLKSCGTESPAPSTSTMWSGFVRLQLQPLTLEQLEHLVSNRIAPECVPALKLPSIIRGELAREDYGMFRDNPFMAMLLVNLSKDVYTKEDLTMDNTSLKSFYHQSKLDEPVVDSTTLGRVDLFRKAFMKLLEFNSTSSCLTPPEMATQVLVPHRVVYGKAHVTRPSVFVNPGESFLDDNMIDLLQFSAYQAHERNQDFIKLADLHANLKACSDEQEGARRLEMLIHCVAADRSPVLLAHNITKDHKFDAIRFSHIAIQEHFVAEHIAKSLIDLFETLDDDTEDAGEPTEETQDEVQDENSMAQSNRVTTIPPPHTNGDGESVHSPSSRSMPPVLKAKLKEAVQRMLLGHFNPSQYRITTPWFQRAITMVFGILYDYQERPCFKRRRYSSTSMFPFTGATVETPVVHRKKQGGTPSSGAVEQQHDRAKGGHAHKVMGAQAVMGRRSQTMASTNVLLAATRSASQSPTQGFASRPKRRKHRGIVTAVMKSMVTACCELQTYLGGRAPVCVETFWLHACMGGNLNVVQGMIDVVGSDTLLLATNADRNNALHLAAMRNQVEVINLLMKEDAVDNDFLDQNNRHGWDPSNMAMVFNHTLCFRLLCRTDGDKVAERDRASRRPALLKGTVDGDTERVRGEIAKLNCKADLDVVGSSGMTSAMWAARLGHAEILKMLIDHGAEVVDSLVEGISTLIFAVEGGQHECVKILLEAGARATDHTPDEDSALLCACSFGFDEVARTLIDAGASALEALVVSCVQGKDSTVRGLVEAGLVDVNNVWEELMVTPLAGACVAGHLSTVRLLLALGADPNVEIDVEYGSTPLMLACHMGNPEVVQAMIDGGANVNAVTPMNSECSEASGEHTTCVKIARVNGHTEVERLLRNNGGHEYIHATYDSFMWLGGRLLLPTETEEDRFPVNLRWWQWQGGRTAGQHAWSVQV